MLSIASSSSFSSCKQRGKGVLYRVTECFIRTYCYAVSLRVAVAEAIPRRLRRTVIELVAMTPRLCSPVPAEAQIILRNRASP